MLIVGIAGKAGSGKNTVANYIEKRLANFDIHSHQVSFASRLKIGISTMFDIPYEWTQTENGKKEKIPWLGNKTVREILQYVGTEIARGIDENVWINLVDKFLEDNKEIYKDWVIIIPDVRFENEARWVLSKNGMLLYIDASKRLQDKKYEHSSELFEWVRKFVYNNMLYVVDNNMDLDALKKQIDVVVYSIVARVKE